MVIFVESSALVKRYIAEVGTFWVDATVAACDAVIAAATPVEVTSAVWRSVRDGHQAKALLAPFDADLPMFNEVPLDFAVVTLARELVLRHGLRAYDAVQLASALTMDAALTAAGSQPLAYLMSADLQLNQAAVAEGLAVEDPNQHP